MEDENDAIGVVASLTVLPIEIVISLRLYAKRSRLPGAARMPMSRP